MEWKMVHVHAHVSSKHCCAQIRSLAREHGPTMRMQSKAPMQSLDDCSIGRVGTEGSRTMPAAAAVAAMIPTVSVPPVAASCSASLAAAALAATAAAAWLMLLAFQPSCTTASASSPLIATRMPV